jgi:hypothetical protein
MVIRGRENALKRARGTQMSGFPLPTDVREDQRTRAYPTRCLLAGWGGTLEVRQVMRSRMALTVVLGGLVFCSCGGSTPATPTPTPTPTAVPTPTPTPTPDPDTLCIPDPPPIYGFVVKVHADFGFKKILDSRALVADVTYCTAVGYPGYQICVVRDENDPQAVTCNNHVTGKAADTGRYGPTWSWNGQPCRGAGDGSEGPGCKNHPTNQFLVFAFGPGDFMACAEGGQGCRTLTIK